MWRDEIGRGIEKNFKQIRKKRVQKPLQGILENIIKEIMNLNKQSSFWIYGYIFIDFNETKYGI